MLIEDGDVLLVDAGLPPGLRQMLAPHVDVCILTHFHASHATGARDFRSVWVPRAEAAAFRGADEYMDVAGVARRERDVVKQHLAKCDWQPLSVTKTYRPGGLLKLDRHEWRFLAAPGHSPGLTLLHDPKRHILFAADLDGSDGCPWYGYPSSELDELEKTARELANVDVALLVSSHAPVRKRGIRQMFRGIAERIQEREKRVLAALATPMTLDDLVAHAPVTGRRPSNPIESYFERVMTEKHLLRLLAKDYVGARQDGRYERLG